MSTATLQLLRMIAVLALVCIAAAIATPPGRLPLAMRGLARILRRDRGMPDQSAPRQTSTFRRVLAFALVIIAAVLALI